MFAGRYNDAYRKAELDHVENFETPLIRETFKAMLDDWTNDGVRPLRQPGRDRQALRREARQQHRRPSPAAASPPSGWSACPATSRSAPTPPTRSTACSPTSPRTSPRSTPSRASRARSPRSTCSPTSAAPTSRGTRRSSACARTACTARRPRSTSCRSIHGNDRVEWFVQLSDEIRWEVEDRDTGAPRAKVIMKAGDVAAMPADIRHQGYSPEALDAARLGERLARAPRADPHRQGLRRTRSSSSDAGERARPSCSSAASSSTRVDGGDGRGAQPPRLLGAGRGRRGPRRRRRPGRRPRPADAFPAWRRMAAAERGRLLLRLADAIEAHADELATLESTDTGHPIKDSTRPRRPPHRRLLPLLRRHGRQAPGRRHPGRDRASSTTSTASRSAWSGRSCRGTSR